MFNTSQNPLFPTSNLALTYSHVGASLSDAGGAGEVHSDVGELGGVDLIHTHRVAPHTKLVNRGTLAYTYLQREHGR